jgi:hypothetical protein
MTIKLHCPLLQQSTCGIARILGINIWRFSKTDMEIRAAKRRKVKEENEIFYGDEETKMIPRMQFDKR